MFQKFRDFIEKHNKNMCEDGLKARIGMLESLMESAVKRSFCMYVSVATILLDSDWKGYCLSEMLLYSVAMVAVEMETQSQ